MPLGLLAARAVDVGRARSALDLFGQVVRAMTWRLLHPRA
jgi:hypothetical protein